MAISMFFGFDSLKALSGTHIDDFSPIGVFPLRTDNHTATVTGGVTYTDVGTPSTFRHFTLNGKSWIRCVTSIRSRAPATSCQSYVDTSGVGRRYCRRRLSTAAQVSDMERNRILDSTGRTPALILTFRDAFGDFVDDPRCRYFTMGFRVKFYNGTQSFNSAVLKIGNGDSSAVGTRTTIFPTNIPLDENDEAFLEITIDRETGVVRRWVDEVEISRVHIAQTIRTNVSELNFFINERSLTTAGVRQQTTSACGLLNYPSCPTATYIPSDSGAPVRCDYAVADFYALVDTRHMGDDFFFARLGDISVEAVGIKDVLVDRHWQLPTNGETPKDTLSRARLNDTVSGRPTLRADVIAPPLRVFLQDNEIASSEEIIGLEVSTHGYSPAANGASKMRVIFKRSGHIVHTDEKELSVNRLSSYQQTPRVMEQITLGQDYGITLDGVEINVSFVND